MKKQFINSLAIVAVALSFSAFKPVKPLTADDKEILGAGATFPYPLYSKMFSEYDKAKGIKVNYQSIGSGGGIQQLTNKTVDFGASDAYMSDEDMKKLPAPAIHVPTCLGAVVVTFNLPGVTNIKLSSEVIAKIFLGQITKWDDAGITKVNSGVKLPSMSIIIAHRSDGSGTSFVFTDYLSKVSPEWKTKVGTGKSVNWPAGLGAKGNEGVAGLVKQTPGTIGYVELAYAFENKMSTADVQNKKGKFIKASIESVSKAAAVKALPVDTRISITDTDAPEGYPISSFTWVLVYKNQNYDGRTENKAKEVVKLIWWMVHDGQKLASPLNYAPLPADAVKLNEKNLKGITYNNKPLL